ncbi:glycoside hydrolase family 36 protein [Aaosphaeria arxii CBS 175.79]|uniref:Glycoside hydrolase family 36 protein n=1 Tax=Aaosphaeria arxii CBS 175.79 TaxID=1450172 RepID=A0A6A5YBD3_9PLEO|nr:glycoside hydrolase family 36 protein [Aaosphaeria arxii CBS 175.79]KAF2022040.1 glycoside hydrolase family 36 protein [Aaosphaeria arxii CBS 175.79]
MLIRPLCNPHIRLSCNPPLGQSTTLAPGKKSVRFTVLVESTTDKSLSVALWHNSERKENWTSVNLKPIEQSPSVITVDSLPIENAQQQWFAGDLNGNPKDNASISFTVTFRESEEEPWKWVNDQFSSSDGHIFYQAAGSPDDDLSKYFDGISSSLQIKKDRSDTPDTTLWHVSGPVRAASGKASGYSTIKLGRPTSYSGWFALVRLWSPWLAPRQGRGDFRLDKEAVLTVFQRQDGTHIAVLAISGVDDVLTLLHHDGDGNVVINARNDSENDGVAQLVLAAGNTLEDVVAATMYYARRIVLKYEASTGQLTEELKALQDAIKPEWLENWYDGLTYCTWNGLGQKLREEKLFEALDSLKENGINITSLIIDDNWQNLNHEGGNQFNNAWSDFEATPVGFPRGLKATISDVRNKHKNIQHVAVWHALFGYWGGIDPKGKIAQEYNTVTVQKKDGVAGGRMLVVAQEDVRRFYDDFYRFLSSAGIDSVKTDAQFFLDELDDAPDRRALISSYQDAWNIAQLRHFSAKAISCMSQTPQLIFHSQLPTNKPRILLRNSDDFFPEVAASHPWHIFCNAHNAILNQHLNILPDWDMFQTSHEWASFHAAARCVSGGPIYITDVPGKHDVDLINQMTGRTLRGNTVILRPHTVGKSLNAYNSYDDLTFLKVSTYVGMAKTGVSILGLFNCTAHPISELIGLDQFPGAEEGTYVLRSHKTGKVTLPRAAKDNSSYARVDLLKQGWEILSAFPAQTFTLKRSHEGKGPGEVTVANLGLLGKMTGGAAIVNTDSYVDQESGKLRIWTSLKSLGTYGLYISDLKQRSIEDDFFALVFGRGVASHCVKINETCENVLEIDLDRAWEESGSKADWSNEIAIEVVIR